MISIKNKEKEQCEVKLVDFVGRIHYETCIAPSGTMDIDLKTISRGIYFLIFYTTTTSFIQEFIKY